MSTIATQAQAQENGAIIDQRRLGVVVMSAVAVVAGLAAWFFASRIGHDSENTGTVVGVLVASIGLGFFFPALKTYVLARRLV